MVADPPTSKEMNMKLRTPIVCLLLALAGQAQAAAQWKILPPTASPALTLPGLDGQAYDLASDRGKVVLVNFWATYCHSCRQEAPSLSRLARRLAPQGLAVLGVDVAEDAPTIRQFMASTHLEYPVVLDQDTAAIGRWHAVAMPTTFLVDRQGRVRARITGEVDWDTPEMDRYLAPYLAEAR
jgi:thiol-disulfide isomerase/thioredoxin